MASTGEMIVRNIVALLLPHNPEVEPALRQQLEGEVGAYVAEQIDAMPGFMRLPYKLVLLGFEILPVLRYGRRFTRLPRPRQASYLARWSDAPILPLRDFIKLIRSSALLVYFDHAALLTLLEAQRVARALPAPPRSTGGGAVIVARR